MKKYLYILSALALITLSGCNPNEFLDRNSLTVMDDSNYWTSEGNVRLFVNGAYGSYLTGYSDNWGQVYAPGVYSSGEYSDDHTSSGQQRSILVSRPADNWYRGELGYRGYWLARRGSGPWNFAYIRKWNLLLDRLNTMKENKVLNDEQYKHWSGVARFLRGWEYSRFVESFGDVPYYGHVVATNNMDDMYRGRDPRTAVMDSVKADFDYAIANVRVDDGKDYINQDVVGTIASRLMLFEGTWYIYHESDEAMKTCTDVKGHAKTYLEAAVKYAEVVINKGKYKFDTDFRTLFGNLSASKGGKTTLTGVAGEVINYRAYDKDLNSSAQHCIASYAGGNNAREGQTSTGNLSTLKAWICVDGKPYSSTTVEGADSWRLQDMVKTRDPRFEASFLDEPHNSQTGLYCQKFIDRQGVKYYYEGGTSPAYYNSCTNENGFPCVRYSETVLNWLEAKAELADKFGGAAVTQSDVDKSINAIRNRPLDNEAIAKGVQKTAPLYIANIPNDPERNSSVIKGTHGYAVAGEISPLIWEIRRERRMEFFMEQYRVLDIRRWGQLELMNGATNPDILAGAWVELDCSGTINDKDDYRYGQVTNLKKCKTGGYNILTKANAGTVAVYYPEYKADGTFNLSDPVFFEGVFTESGSAISSNAEKMRGFLRPVNIRPAQVENYDVRNYLEPICGDVLTQYRQKGYELAQNPGWPAE
ncbi:MAG: RagB/SusD family nutrient uptake outer membrane protein [Bacteroidales bacterium]|nr:RagB/SusD family nutrient uptake outer membrane protein [Bacteroidales bacterium]